LIIKRGDIFYADLSPVIGSEQGGIRPVLIIQNNVGNLHSPTVIVAAITSQISKNKLPTHIEIPSQKTGLKIDSVILAEQIRTIDKSRLKEKICHIKDKELIDEVNLAIGISFGLENITARKYYRSYGGTLLYRFTHHLKCFLLRNNTMLK